jgi:ParB-like chromosome segregation protein Spo0J
MTYTSGSEPFHELANLFPEMDAASYPLFREDVRQQGLLEEIVRDPETRLILDGRSRWRACRELGIEPRYRDWDRDRDAESPLAFVISRNLHRRHLTTSQRAMVAAALIQLLRRQQPSALVRPKGKASAEAGRALKVSARSVENAVKVLRDGSPELAAAVQEGQVAVRPAADIASLPPAEQAERIRSAERRAGRQRQHDGRKDCLEQVERKCRQLGRLHARFADIADRADAELAQYLRTVQSTTEI